MVAPIINLSFIIREIGDHPDVVREMLETFESVLVDFEEQMTIYLPQENYQQIMIIAHRIKPGLKMFGLNSLHATISKMEENARNETGLAEIKKGFLQFQKTLPIVRSEIQQLIRRNS